MGAIGAGEPIDAAFVTDRLSAGDRLEVLATRSRQVTAHDDPAAVAAICAALDRLPDPWTHPVEGVPVAPLRFDFYRGTEFVGSLGVARSCLVAHVAGGFACYGLDDERVGAELKRIVGIDGPPRRASVRAAR